MPNFRKIGICFCFVVFAAGTAVAQVTVSGSFKTRLDSWNWFGDNQAGEYTYPGSLLRVGVSGTSPSVDWQVEAAVPFVLGLPNNATVAGAQGALGPGANYFASNGNERDAAMLFLKQGTVRFKRLAGVPGQSLKIGRFEFVDGGETTPEDPTLATVKRDRVAQRLLGNFAFSHTGRSIDGAQYGLARGDWTVTGMIGRPTRGAYDLNGWDELDITVGYWALTRRLGSKAHAADVRTFAVAYDDNRQSPVKVDNRPLAVRTADGSRITVETFGGHYLRADETSAGIFDLMVWGAGQIGSWGTQSQRAGAFAVEGGWQPDTAGTPWLRGGWNYGSGDGNPSDGVHGTFFQMLPTPRLYARTPFFNLMNSSDFFGETIVHPTKRVTLRGDLHAIHLADANDLWYQGGGAYQASTFGFTGRVSNGQTVLATMADISADYAVSQGLTVSGYYGHAATGAVTDAIYGNSPARFAYVEFLVRF